MEDAPGQFSPGGADRGEQSATGAARCCAAAGSFSPAHFARFHSSVASVVERPPHENEGRRRPDDRGLARWLKKLRPVAYL